MIVLRLVTPSVLLDLHILGFRIVCVDVTCRFIAVGLQLHVRRPNMLKKTHMQTFVQPFHKQGHDSSLTCGCHVYVLNSY